MIGLEDVGSDVAVPPPSGIAAIVVCGSGARAWGVTGADGGSDPGPVLTPFVAVTVNVYAVPFARPVTVAVVDEAATVAVWPPDAVTV